jgi:hypothetical protein
MRMSVSKLGLAAILLIAMQTESRSEAIVSCPKTAGFIGGPFVPTEDVAREIYRIMVGAIAPRSIEEYPLIVIKDQGDSWWASQERLQPTDGFGGGQLYMYIDKCTGAISRAAFNK